MVRANSLSLAILATTQVFGVFGLVFELKPKVRAVPEQTTSQGCFLSQGNLTEVALPARIGNSVGACETLCKEKKTNVMALHGSKCYCGPVYPEKDSVTKDEDCDLKCLGFEFEPCGNTENDGGVDAWSVYNLGFETDVSFFEKEKTETTSAAPAATTTAAKTSAADNDSASGPTETGQPDENKDEEKKGPNVAAIAAGVVVGVAIVAGAIAGVFFYMRRKRNAEIEEEHRRNAAVNAFISGAKPPSSSGGISITDSRLEPGLAHRRLSDGSIADNQDYSRKILRVTNA